LIAGYINNRVGNPVIRCIIDPYCIYTRSIKGFGYIYRYIHCTIKFRIINWLGSRYDYIRGVTISDIKRDQFTISCITNSIIITNKPVISLSECKHCLWKSEWLEFSYVFKNKGGPIIRRIIYPDFIYACSI